MKTQFAATLLVIGSLSVASAKSDEKPIFDRLDRLEKLSGHYFKKIESENKSYSEVLAQTLNDPIDYAKFNSNLNFIGARVPGYSKYVKALQLNLDSRLSGAWHRAASFISPKIVPFLPSRLTGGFNLELTKSQAPAGITELSLDFSHYSGLHPRGILGDALAVNLNIKAHSSLAIIKKMFKDAGLYEVCRQNVSMEALPDFPEAGEFVRLGCTIATNLESANNFSKFISENKGKFDEIKTLIDKTSKRYETQIGDLVNETFGRGGRAVRTVSRFLYSYEFEAIDCKNRPSAYCRPNITVSAEAGALAADADLELTLYENQLSIGFQTDVNQFAGDLVREDYRKEGVKAVYTFFKVMEQAKEDELDAIADGMTRFLDEALKYLDKNFADEILLEIKP